MIAPEEKESGARWLRFIDGLEGQELSGGGRVVRFGLYVATFGLLLLIVILVLLEPRHG